MSRLKRNNIGTKKPIVLATGVFDLLHPGHLKFLEASKQRVGANARLVVVVARDETVRRRKGRYPVLNEKDRLKIVKALRTVDRALLGHKHLDLLGILREVKPNFVSVGYDQSEIESAVRKVIRDSQLPIQVIRIREFIGPNYSSTRVRKQVIRKYG